MVAVGTRWGGHGGRWPRRAKPRQREALGPIMHLDEQQIQRAIQVLDHRTGQGRDGFFRQEEDN